MTCHSAVYPNSSAITSVMWLANCGNVSDIDDDDDEYCKADAEVRNHQLLITGKKPQEVKGQGFVFSLWFRPHSDRNAMCNIRRRLGDVTRKDKLATGEGTCELLPVCNVTLDHDHVDKHLPVSAVQTGQPHHRGTRSMRHTRVAPLIFCCPRALLLMSSSLSSLLPLPHRSAHLSLHHSARWLTCRSSLYLC